MSDSLITKFAIANPDGLDHWIGIKVGPFAVAEGQSGWTVTHIVSGLVITKRARSVLHAIAVAEAVIPLVDWSGSVEEMRAHQGRASVRLVTQRVRCPYELRAMEASR